MYLFLYLGYIYTSILTLKKYLDNPPHKAVLSCLCLHLAYENSTSKFQSPGYKSILSLYQNMKTYSLYETCTINDKNTIKPCH